MHVNLAEKFNKFSAHWHPYIVGELNDNHVKVAKLKGEFVWHKHDHEDELFVVLEGTLMMDYRDKKTIATAYTVMASDSAGSQVLSVFNPADPDNESVTLECSPTAETPKK